MRVKVFLCFSGEYEQRRVDAVFSSREIADQYSDDVEEFNVWDRLPEKVRMFEVCGVFAGIPHREIGYQQFDQWQIKRETFEGNEYFLEWWTGEKISWYGGSSRPEHGIYVEVKGGSRKETDRRFKELQSEVESGKRPTGDA